MEKILALDLYGYAYMASVPSATDYIRAYNNHSLIVTFRGLDEKFASITRMADYWTAIITSRIQKMIEGMRKRLSSGK